MAWLISVLGAALALAGAISLGNGISYIRLDWGQTETVAGTVALSAGIIVLAIGAVLFALRDLARRRPRAASTGIGLEAPADPDGDEAVPRPALRRFKSRLATVGLPRAETTVPEAVRDLDAPVPPAERPPLDAPVRETPPVESTPAAVLPSPDHPVVETPHPAPLAIDAPTVVGRYEANGASYVLFSDGTIEVETDSGTHRFASMGELKEHIERQDAVETLSGRP